VSNNQPAAASLRARKNVVPEPFDATQAVIWSPACTGYELDNTCEGFGNISHQA
jgi:hypothetical protein